MSKIWGKNKTKTNMDTNGEKVIRSKFISSHQSRQPTEKPGHPWQFTVAYRPLVQTLVPFNFDNEHNQGWK